MANWTKAGQAYPSWNSKNNEEFKEGSELEGVISEKQSGVGINNSNVYVVEKANGEMVSVWGTAILDRIFATLPVGTTVKVKYLGYAKGKKGNKYHNYEVYYDKDTIPAKDIVEIAKEEFKA